MGRQGWKSQRDSEGAAVSEVEEPNYLLGLLKWADVHSIEFNRKTAENQWMSIPIPTRRFGSDAWVMFSMRTKAGESAVGPFVSWTVLALSLIHI